MVGTGGKPDVFHAVFPVAQSAAPLFPLPGDAVLQAEMVFQDRTDDKT